MGAENKDRPLYSNKTVQIARKLLGLPTKYLFEPHPGMPREELERNATIAWQAGGITPDEVESLGMKVVGGSGETKGTNNE
jgi:hypothetical protein